MILSQKESSLLKDLRSQEKLCVEKYAKYAAEANDPRLQGLFSRLGQQESQHLQTIDQLSSGQIPSSGSSGGSGGSGSQQQSSQSGSSGGSGGQQQSSQSGSSGMGAGSSGSNRQRDAFLCADALAMEKHVSSEYDLSIFEFSDPAARNALNHIQKEEQQHGLELYQYMSQNGLYS